MALPLETPFYSIAGAKASATFGTLVEMLLRTRLKLSLEDEGSANDEDVNTYLAGLLFYYIDPHYLSAVSEVLSHHDTDLHQSVLKAGSDRVQTYWIYKANADDLLLDLGVFRSAWAQAQGQVERARHYYLLASEYNRRIYHHSTAVADIQVKLAEAPERYLTILSKARQEYMDFVSQVGMQELNQFSQELQTESKLREKQDEMLDAYLAWTKAPADGQARTRLVSLVEELKKLDPNFNFTCP